MCTPIISVFCIFIWRGVCSETSKVMGDDGSRSLEEMPADVRVYSEIYRELVDFIVQKRDHGHLLVTGISGSGKSHLLRKLVASVPLKGLYKPCHEFFMHEQVGDSERSLADACLATNYDFVVLDNVELIGRASSSQQANHPNNINFRLLSVLCHCLDQGKTLIVGITAEPEALHADLQRYGRMANIIHVSLSSKGQRRILLDNLLTDHNLSPGEKEDLAAMTHGYVVGDFQALCFKAAQSKLYPFLRPEGARAEDTNNIESTLESLTLEEGKERKEATEGTVKLTLEDFRKAMKAIPPSIVNGLSMLKPVKGLDDRPLVGIQDLERTIMEMIRFPIKYADKIKALRLTAPRGVLLLGPSGSGKTCLALHCARLSGLNVIHVQIEGLFSSRGAQNQPGSQDRLIACLLTELDGLSSSRNDGVFILAATSKGLGALDPAILRPGRIGTHLHMPVFGETIREEFIRMKMTQMPLDLDQHQVADLVRSTKGFSPADLDGLFREAAMITLRGGSNAECIEYDTIKKTLVILANRIRSL